MDIALESDLRACARGALDFEGSAESFRALTQVAQTLPSNFLIGIEAAAVIANLQPQAA